MRIDKNRGWLQFESLFQDDIIARYNWFLFEFGKRISFFVHAELLGRLSTVKGTSDYKKRLVVAEFRDLSKRTWWAVAARSRTLLSHEYNPNTTILTVVPRFQLGKGDAIQKILVELGPWTADTIPFVPSLRQAMVVMKKSDEESVLSVRKKNDSENDLLRSLMVNGGIHADTRYTIYEKLKIIPDWEIEAIKIEFGLSEGGRAHWRPSLKTMIRQGLQKILSEEDLIQSMTDPNFTAHHTFKHLRDQLNVYEVMAFEKFQNTVRP